MFVRDTMVKADKTLDIAGTITPRAEMMTRATLAAMEPGRVLTVVTTDRSAGPKLTTLCANLGCTLLELWEDGGTFSFYIRK